LIQVKRRKKKGGEAGKRLQVREDKESKVRKGVKKREKNKKLLTESTGQRENERKQKGNC